MGQVSFAASRMRASLQNSVQNFPALECAPAGGQIEELELTPSVGLPENGSHDEASIPQRRVQTPGR